MNDLAFCKYCASVMELEYQQLTGNVLLLKTNRYTIYRPHLDLNQMADVVDKLNADLLGVDIKGHLLHGHNLKKKGTRAAFRDFIISTM